MKGKHIGMKITNMNGRFKDEIIELTASGQLKVSGLEDLSSDSLKSLVEGWLMPEHHLEVVEVTQDGENLSITVDVVLDLGVPAETSTKEFCG